MQGQGDVDNITRTIWRVVRLRISQSKGAPSLARRTTVTLAHEVAQAAAIECVHLVPPPLCMCQRHFPPTVPSGAEEFQSTFAESCHHPTPAHPRGTAALP